MKALYMGSKFYHELVFYLDSNKYQITEIVSYTKPVICLTEMDFLILLHECVCICYLKSTFPSL